MLPQVRFLSAPVLCYAVGHVNVLVAYGVLFVAKSKPQIIVGTAYCLWVSLCLAANYMYGENSEF